MKLIPLWRNKTQYKKLTPERIIEAYSKVDDDDYERFSKYSWHMTTERVNKYTQYAYRGAKIGGKSILIWLHREIIGAKTGEQVDHINGDGLDNTKINIRICNKGQNGINRFQQTKWKNGIKSQYRGVSWHDRDKRWRASITQDKKVICLGGFKSEHEAGGVYNNWVIKNRDPAYSWLNYIEGESLIVGWRYHNLPTSETSQNMVPKL